MRTILYFREGNSDKVYQTAIEPAEGGFVVNFAYGRRGSTLQTGTKTQRPVSEEEARKIAAKLIAEKQAKGYTIEADGTPFLSTENEGRATGIHCQLLNSIEEDRVSTLLQDSRHVLQEKHDGRRMLVRKQGSEIIGINRRGLAVTLPKAIENEAREIPGDFLIDGEAVGDLLHAFDLLEVVGSDTRQWGFLDRHDGLIRLLANGSAIRAVSIFVEPAAKQKEFLRLRNAGAEGVVFKDRTAHFHAGRPASGGTQLKFKFVTTASFIVGAVNNRRSVALLLLDDDKEVPAGNVTITPSFDLPEVGAIVEVRYLYAFKESGSVYQPVFLGARDDLERADCTLDQLKYKAGQ
ncbi:WGR domain-containing protein [Haloferula sp. BvORR071]|uniref:WGR domain-containing protein n=1 Tax=Haloferula sp. BvORR071 TaxID=1396141 RepID=UPI00054FCE96|nr:WGR domain-containing protein [Haloferula sp. BvORR071]